MCLKSDRTPSREDWTKSPCITWPGVESHTGYVHATIGGKPTQLVHRALYEQWWGPIPEGLTVDHLCSNRACLNPMHYEAVSLWENIIRGNSPSAKNYRKTHCKYGHPFIPENTYFYEKNGHRVRQCIPCRRERNRQLRAAKKVAP